MTVLFQFVTIFLGAFFAFGLENYREQRRTRRWVHEYLGHLAADLGPALEVGAAVRAELAATTTAAQAWQRAERPRDLDEAAWRRLAEIPRSSGLDLSPVLRTEAITVLDHETAHALAEVERAGRLLEMGAAHVTAMHERDVLPLWYERRAPLEPDELRRVARFELELDQLSSYTEAALASVQQWLALYRGQPQVTRPRAPWRDLWPPRSRPGTPPAPDGSPTPGSR